MNKRWLVIPVASIVLTIAVASTAAVLADEGDTDDSKIGRFASKVAVILGLNEEEVAGALKQARQELMAEFTQEKLNSMVENGNLTQEQADEKLESWQSNPPQLKNKGRHLKGMKWHHKIHSLDIEAVQAKLNSMVENGDLTQEQVDEKLEWINLKSQTDSTVTSEGKDYKDKRSHKRWMIHGD